MRGVKASDVVKSVVVTKKKEKSNSGVGGGGSFIAGEVLSVSTENNRRAVVYGNVCRQKQAICNSA